MRKFFWVIALCGLALAACSPAAALTATPAMKKPTPPLAGTPLEQQTTPDDSQGVTPPAPQWGPLEPSDLPLELLAWGAPVDGTSGTPPLAVMFKSGEQPDPAWLAALPAEVQAALSAALRAPAAGEWVILLYGGTQPCPAYRVVVNSAVVAERALKLTWQVLPPEPNTGCASVIAYPYLLLRLQNGGSYAETVEFILGDR